MTKTKKPAINNGQLHLKIDAASLEDRGKGLPFEYSNESIEQSLTPIEKKFFKLLRAGKENAVSSDYLCQKLGVKVRAVVDIAKRCRLKHCAIGSSSTLGYWRFKDYSEFYEWIQKTRKNKAESEKVLDAMELNPLAQQNTVKS